MSRNERRTGCRRFIGRIVTGIALSAMAVSASRAQATAIATPDPQPWPEAETVRTLLRADAAAALADCRMPGICAAGGGKSALTEPPARVGDDIRVAAIFGTARSLSVDIVLNGALLRYRAGRAEPVAGPAATTPYRLLAIDGACVRLHRDGRDQTACLDPGGPRP